MTSVKVTIPSRFLSEAKAFKGMQGRLVRLGKKVKATKAQIGIDGDDFIRDRRSVIFFR